MFDKRVFIVLSMFLMLLLIAIPACSAADSDLNESISQTTVPPEVLKQDDAIYYDASQSDDGNGTWENPYKYVTSERLKGNARHCLGEGEYELDAYTKLKMDTTLIGSGADKTILKYNGPFTLNNNVKLTLINITFEGITINNYGTVNASNTVFCHGCGVKEADKYGNIVAGAIYSPLPSSIILDNATFHSNHAGYGGAIYIKSGALEIKNSKFINNTALNYGGAIVCENIERASIQNTQFINSTCTGDGGAVYINNAKLNASDCEFTGSEALFGGAVCSVNGTVVINRCNFTSNRARHYGGAAYQLFGNLTLSASTLTNNAAGLGGGLYSDDASLIVKNNRIINNTALKGSGTYILFNSSASLTDNTYTNNELYSTNELNMNIGGGNYTVYHTQDTEVILPERYDLRDCNYTTPVKSQDDSGSCWAFATIAALESCLKKITGEDFDLSEGNMKNLLAHHSHYGRDIDTNHGGYDNMGWGYLTSWLGPVLESDDEYDDKNVLSPVLNSILHIQNILFLNRQNYTDNREIKEAIMKYGAVVVCINYNSKNLNNVSYYNPTNLFGTNHMVTIIGWDDAYSKSNFATTPSGDGAWIVQSSWGEDWADKGCAYVSYYDRNMAISQDSYAAFTFIFNDTCKFDKNYQYDIAGATNFLYSDNPSVWYKTRFTSDDFEVLRGVSTYFEKQSNWTVSVYLNSQLKTVKSGVSPAGYWTITLDDFIPLTPGDVFEVVFNVISEDKSAVAICEKNLINTLTFGENMSFISYDGENWNDLFNYTASYDKNDYSSQTACIKAFTILNSYTVWLNVTCDGCSPANITAVITDEYGNPALGNVTFNLSGQIRSAELIGGVASLVHEFIPGLHYISASYHGFGNETSIEIPKKEIIITITVTQNLNNVSIVISSGNVNASGILTINNIHDSFNLINGTAIYSLINLDNGFYNVSAILNDDWFEGYGACNFTVNVIKKLNPSLAENRDITMYYGAGKSYTVKAYKDSGVVAAPGEIVKITINSKTYDVKVGKNGIASFKITLKAKTYRITASYNGVKVSNTIRIKPTLITKNLKVKKRKTVKFKAKLLNSKGKAVKFKKITFKIKGKKYRVKTNKKGIAVLKIKNLKVGKYKIITSYAKLKNTNKITVKK